MNRCVATWPIIYPGHVAHLRCAKEGGHEGDHVATLPGGRLYAFPANCPPPTVARPYGGLSGRVGGDLILFGTIGPTPVDAATMQAFRPETRSEEKP